MQKQIIFPNFTCNIYKFVSIYFCFFRRKLFLFQSSKNCDVHSNKISKHRNSNFINWKGKTSESLLLHEKKSVNGSPKKLLTVSDLSKVKTLVTRVNSPMHKSITKSLKRSISTGNKIINQDFQLKTTEKHNVHQLLHRHMTQRKTSCKILFKKYLAGVQWKCIVTFIETWIYLRDCNKRKEPI